MRRWGEGQKQGGDVHVGVFRSYVRIFITVIIKGVTSREIIRGSYNGKEEGRRRNMYFPENAARAKT